MSVYADVFIRAEQSLDELQEDISKLLFIPFSAEGENRLERYRSVLLGVDLWLCSNEGMVNDRDMPFTRYDHALGMQVRAWPGSEEVYHGFRQQLAVFLARAIHTKLGHDVMGVDEVQKVLWSSGDQERSATTGS